MGEHIVNTKENIESRNQFVRHLLNDVAALEKMLANNLIEENRVRIGAEQEFFLMDENWRPSLDSDFILLALNDFHFTTEITRYTLEINLDPLEAHKDCFKKMEMQLVQLLKKAKNVAGQYRSKILLTGVLPTISKNELAFKYMTPQSRYLVLNETTKRMRGGDFSLHINGVDELYLLHDSILFEGCNASFQMHLQIPPQDFIASYNWSQAIAGPVLAICTNSPLLLGRELWSETRIALFQQSVDTRASSYALKDQDARVSFGQEWATGSIVDIFKRDIARHKVMLTKHITENSLDELKSGKIPELKALKIHNGTIFHWNRACYGISDGKPHMRIENRYVPAGPTVIDEMANFAFWVGLLAGRPTKFDDMPSVMDFKDAKSNFLKAARTGRESIMHWQGELITATDLVINHLLPIAYTGLEKLEINRDDSERLLGIIEKRVLGQTGAQWQISNYHRLCKNLKKDDAIVSLTKAIYNNQQNNLPVHLWPKIADTSKVDPYARLVGHIMSTQLFVVHEHDLADLATSIMLWHNIHHLPIENDQGKLAGLLTWTHMQRNHQQHQNEHLRVSEIMTKNPLTVGPETTIQEAIKLMKEFEYGCLPVVSKDELLGIITIKDVDQFNHDKSI